ncbi:MAG: hypothetical protein COB51_12240, partial [Moraxellaceae bacterium]
MKQSSSKSRTTESTQLFNQRKLMLEKKREKNSRDRVGSTNQTQTHFENVSGVDLTAISDIKEAHDYPSPFDATPTSSPAPADGPSTPLDGPTNSSVAGSFLATRYSFAAPAFGQVAWNTHEPLATYSAWLDGSDWRFRLDTLTLKVPVGVADGGRTDITGASSAEVKKTTWSTVESDLRPGGA